METVLITAIICGTVYKLAELVCSKKGNRPQNNNSDRR